jgi:tetratricopeptide (TPR) repeat protein
MAATPIAAIERARDYIEQARVEGDPRYLGHALGVLAPWPDARTAPLDLAVLRATVHQSLHQFARALADLDVVLRRDPRHAQALLTRATVLQVLGRVDEAARDCHALARVHGGLAASTCSASVASLSGRGRAAFVLLEYTLRNAGDESAPGERAWSHSVLAEIAERNGDLAAAAANFRVALAIDPGDRYVRAAYADLLLDQGDSRGVLALTANAWSDDNLLLRRALALAALGSPQRADAVAALADRYAAAHRRADALHLREEARFALHLQHDAARALDLAASNWAVQKEPADARILLQAAVAAGDRAQEQTAREWLQRAGVSSQYMQRIIASVPGARAGASS